MKKLRTNKINNLKHGYENNFIGGFFYDNRGIYQEQYVWLKNEYKRPTIENKFTGEKIIGLKKINKLMEIKELELEQF